MVVDPRFSGQCRKCQKRPGSIIWVGDGGPMAFVHGAGEWWCEICVCEDQLAYCEERAAEIPDLRSKLARLRTSSGI